MSPTPRKKNPTTARRRGVFAHQLALLIAALCCGWGLSSCKQASHMRPRHLHRQHTQPRPDAQRQREALSRKLLSTLGVARSHHRRASIYEAQGQPAQALREIDAILALRFPKGYRAGEEMLLDAWGRKALLQLKHKQPKAALHTIEQALKRPSWLKHSFYRAQLYHIRGRILHELKQPKAALRAYQRSIDHNKAVIREAQQALKDAAVSAPLQPGDPR